jgi:hypothetical protein
MIEFIGPLHNLFQHFTNHYLRLDTLDFWPHYCLCLIGLGLWLHSLGSDCSTENTSITQQWISSSVAYSLERVYLPTVCLPRICLRGKVFIEPLPSSGYARHNINATRTGSELLKFGNFGSAVCKFEGYESSITPCSSVVLNYKKLYSKRPECFLHMIIRLSTTLKLESFYYPNTMYNTVEMKINSKSKWCQEWKFPSGTLASLYT